MRGKEGVYESPKKVLAAIAGWVSSKVWCRKKMEAFPGIAGGHQIIESFQLSGEKKLSIGGFCGNGLSGQERSTLQSACGYCGRGSSGLQSKEYFLIAEKAGGYQNVK